MKPCAPQSGLLPSAWPMWPLCVFVTAATLACFVGVLRHEFNYKVR